MSLPSSALPAARPSVRALAALTVLVLLLAAAPAARAARAGSTTATGERRSTAVLAPSADGQRLRDARAVAGDGPVAATLLDLAVRAGDVEGRVLMADGARPQPAVEDGDGNDDGTAAGTGDGTWAQVVMSAGVGYSGDGSGTFPIGDLDRDGHDDIVTLTHDAAGVTLVALSGVDGVPLWITPQPDGLVGTLLQAVPDVDGDGRRDLLATGVGLSEYSGSGHCDETSCRDEFVESVTWEVSMLSGATGTSLWRDAVDGHVSYAYDWDFDTGEETYRIESSNFPLAFHASGDLDGDAELDLISTRTTYTESSDAERTGTFPGPVTTTETHSFEGASTILLVDGADGTTIRQLEESGQGTVLHGVPVPDIDGDALTDVLVTRTHGANGSRTCTQLLIQLQCQETSTLAHHDVLLLDGADLSTAWSHEVLSESVGARAPGDLTGDGAVDVVITDRSASSDPESSRPHLTVLDATDGTQLWTWTAPTVDGDAYSDGVSLVATTPIDDVAGKDLVLRRQVFTYDSDTGEESGELHLIRLAGDDGEELLTTVTVGTTYWYDSRAADADGDGTDDVVLQGFHYDEQTGEETSLLLVEAGDDGETLLTRDLPTFADLTVLGDVDGDGGAEAVVIDFGIDVVFGHDDAGASEGTGSDDPDANGTDVFALDGGAVRWTVPAVPDGFTTIEPAGDLDGAGDGVDLLVQSFAAFGDVPMTLTAARAGADGRLLWSDPDPVAISRVEGPSRTATAAALSAATRRTAATVVIARADAWPDAIAGGPLASMMDASLLLTARDGLSADAAAEIARLGADRAVLLGGEQALSAEVDADLRAAGLTVERLAGSDRFATAGLIAQRVVAEAGDGSRVAVVRGTHPDPEQGWSDAVVAAAHGAADGHPILLTPTDGLPPSTLDALTTLSPTSVLVLGGPAAVSVDAEQQVRDTGARTLRVSGTDRYSTARIVADLAVDAGTSPHRVWVATGRRFPDALAASAAVGTGGVLLLADGDTNDRAEELLGFIGTHRDEVAELVLIGGSAALSDTLETRLRRLLAE